MLTTISVRFKFNLRENVKWLFKRKGLDMCLCMKSYQKTLKSEHPVSFKNYLKDKKLNGLHLARKYACLFTL